MKKRGRPSTTYAIYDTEKLAFMGYYTFDDAIERLRINPQNLREKIRNNELVRDRYKVVKSDLKNVPVKNKPGTTQTSHKVVGWKQTERTSSSGRTYCLPVWK